MFQRSILALFAIATLTPIVSINVPAQARTICQVTDPTGTPLNVRDRPNGAIVNALRNGREVDILRVDYDERGRPWALVGSYYEGEYRTWGYVYREFVSCYQQ